jgi:hypothetical protein
MLVHVNFLDRDDVGANMTHMGKEGSNLAQAREAASVDADQVEGRSGGAVSRPGSKPGAAKADGR